MQLLQSQKNIIFDLITENHFSPSMFKIESIDASTTMIRYIDPGKNYYLKIKTMNGTTHITISPAEERYIENWPLDRYSWDYIYFSIKDWLQYLRREIEQPDKWADYIRLSETFSLSSSNWENNKFTYDEVVEIRKNLDLLKDEINKLDLLSEQIQGLNKSIDYLSEKVSNLNKLDWKNMFVGTIFGQFVDLAIHTETAKHIWGFITQLFNNLMLLTK